MSAQLPIFEVLEELKEQLRHQSAVIVQAAPGAGKSTVIPLQLLHEPWLEGKKILMLEPRRIAARAVATRMASTLGEEVGKTVGYRIRFEQKISKDTRIEVVTEGILTRMLQEDPALEEAGIVIFDEFHERSLHADVSLALLRESQSVLRPGLRLLLMSATFDSQRIAGFLNNAPVVKSAGRQFPVRMEYLAPDENESLVQQMTRLIRQAWYAEEGDMLVFLPGAGEIHRTQEILSGSLPEATLFPLYGELSGKEQDRALLPHPDGKRKIVLATSIAETSLTIEGIKIVVDSGWSRVSRFDPKSGFTRLETSPVTQDAADQRAGRAGRLGPGVCYRNWSKGAHQYLAPERKPEILEADVSSLLLELAQWGITHVGHLSWLDAPPSSAVSQAQRLLLDLGAIEPSGTITKLGKTIVKWPAHPRIGTMLMQAQRKGLSALACDVAAVLEEKDPLPREQGADISLRLELLRKFRQKIPVQAERSTLERIERSAQHWCQLLNVNKEITPPDPYDVGLLLSYAFPERIAKKNDKQGFRLANGKPARLAYSYDPLNELPWLVAAQLDAGTQEGKIFSAAPFDPKQVEDQLTNQEFISWDYQKGQLLARMERRLGSIVVDSTPILSIPEETKLELLADVVKKEKWLLFDNSAAVDNLVARVESLRLWRPSEAWPEFSKEALCAHPLDWIGPYVSEIKKRDDFKKLDLYTILHSYLSWEQQQALQKLAPPGIEVPSGFHVPLQYKEDGSDPVLAVRLQELFGLPETPTVNEGRTQVLLHLLSPGYKPVQVTQDLKSFWNNTYQEVRKELKIRYPKHSWPEDPWTAEAVRGVKKRTS
ncbi:MAG: ATP-dependent helicase HrpB [Cytophagaceae bacterium]|nr:ATP-dependent helicase HrpB [Cytophagaceae bacterium]